LEHASSDRAGSDHLFGGHRIISRGGSWPFRHTKIFIVGSSAGLFFSGGILSQLFFACYFALPFLAGAILIVLSEFFYLQNPESIPWQVNLPEKTGLWPTPGQLYFLFGLIFIFPGINYSKIRADFLPRTTGVFRHLNRMGAYSMIVLAAASLFVLILAFFFIRPYAFNCVVLTIPMAIFSAIVAYWLLTNLDAP
jgi:hypothetical protein